MRRNDFTSFHWLGRPPLKVWRHPENWSVCMTHVTCQYCSTLIPPLGKDPHFDNDKPYVHPWNIRSMHDQGFDEESLSQVDEHVLANQDLVENDNELD